MRTSLFLFLNSIFIFCLNFPLAAEEQKEKVGDNLYLQACGGNPQQYYSTAKKIDNLIEEVPNKVTALKLSPYGRPIITKAVSDIKIENNLIASAELHNFRDLDIYNEMGEIIHTSKVSGASSIYELKYKEKTFAWGVGWHKRCVKVHNTDFTVLRVLLPILKNGKLHIKEKVFNGAFMPKYLNQLNKALEPVILQSSDVYAGSSSCFYCLPRFFKIDNTNGFYELKSPKELSSVGIDIKSIDRMIYISWLSQYGLTNIVADFLLHNYDTVSLDASKYMRRGDFKLSEQKSICIEEVRNPVSLSTIGKACFPELELASYFEDKSDRLH